MPMSLILSPLAGLLAAGEEPAGDLPHGKGDQRHRDQPENQPADGGRADLLHRSVLVGVAAAACGDGDGDRPDDDVHETDHDETCPRHPSEGIGSLRGARGTLR